MGIFLAIVKQNYTGTRQTTEDIKEYFSEFNTVPVYYAKAMRAIGMANQRIRIRLKSFDHRLIDQSAQELSILQSAWVHKCVGLCVPTREHLS